MPRLWPFRQQTHTVVYADDEAEFSLDELPYPFEFPPEEIKYLATWAGFRSTPA